MAGHREDAGAGWTAADQEAVAQRVHQVIQEDYGSDYQLEAKWEAEPGSVRARNCAAVLRQVRAWVPVHALGPRQRAARARGRRGKAPATRKPKTWDVATLATFARLTGRRLAWLVSGEGPEREGEAMPRAELSAAIAASCLAALPPELRAWVAHGGTTYTVDGAACLARLHELTRDALAQARAGADIRRSLSDLASLYVSAVGDEVSPELADVVAHNVGLWGEAVRRVRDAMPRSPLVSGTDLSAIVAVGPAQPPRRRASRTART